MAGFLLLHSPLVGPGTWTPVAEALRGDGHQARTPDLRLSRFASPYYPALETAILAALEDGDVVVAHSGAGALVPAAMQSGRARGAIFVDALLPHPGRPWASTVAAGLAAQLADRAQAGKLPPWSSWLPDGALAGLLPDPEMRRAFVDALEPLPLAYFLEDAPKWRQLDPWRAAYLRLSAAYDAEARQAASAGSRLGEVPSHHLAMLTQPQAIAAALVDLAGVLGVSS